MSDRLPSQVPFFQVRTADLTLMFECIGAAISTICVYCREVAILEVDPNNRNPRQEPVLGEKDYPVLFLEPRRLSRVDVAGQPIIPYFNGSERVLVIRGDSMEETVKAVGRRLREITARREMSWREGYLAATGQTEYRPEHFHATSLKMFHIGYELRLCEGRGTPWPVLALGLTYIR